MKNVCTMAPLVCLAALLTPSGFALSHPSSDPAEDPTVSSSSALPDAPEAGLILHSTARRVRNGAITSLRLTTRPFSAVAVSVNAGLGGLGIDIATPLATKIDLRTSTSFLNYSPSITEDGIPINAAITLRSVGAGVDFFPYHNSFHITPGFTLYNGNHAAATANIAAGSSFTVNDADYTSAPGDPVRGVFDVKLGRKLAPSLTMGFGNMLRRDSHWSVPVDFGFQYIGQPKFSLNMTGSVCDADGDCSTIASDASTMSNLAAEQTKVNQEISPLRFYPILKVGISYRFGRNVSRDYWY